MQDENERHELCEKQLHDTKQQLEKNLQQIQKELEENQNKLNETCSEELSKLYQEIDSQKAELVSENGWTTGQQRTKRLALDDIKSVGEGSSGRPETNTERKVQP